MAFAKTNSHDVVIVDTAGRLSVDEGMMQEIENIKNGIQPTETLFVVDSMTGQDAVNTIAIFNERLNFDGVVLTKLDGDTRGGAALSIKYSMGKPIKFVSSGEKLDTLEVFYPDRMAQRILGMGDIVSFVEKAQEQFDEKKQKGLKRKSKRNKFDFNDFLSQMNQIKKNGRHQIIDEHDTGMGKLTKDVDIDNNAFSKVESIIFSMTPKERTNPELLNMSRKNVSPPVVERPSMRSICFIKQFDQMRQMMQMMTKGKGMERMMQGFNKFNR